MAVTLTPHQQEAVDWLVEALVQGDPLVALKGNAGTGKSTLIAVLRRHLLRRGIDSVVGTPTHRAAAILRNKGVPDATTVHEHALMPYFKADYERALTWLGHQTPLFFRPPDDAIGIAHEDVEGLPWLIYEHVKPDLRVGFDLLRTSAGKNPRRLLGTIGIDGRHYWAGSTPKVGRGVLIVDEASMVGTELLEKCQLAFGQVCLVGDPAQLPPVNDIMVLDTLEGVTLTEIHRQAADSAILRLAYQVRDGIAIWKQALPQNDEVGHVRAVEAAIFRTTPLIVFRNEAREYCTHKIRKALGYTKQTLYPGEPLLCRATSDDLRAGGFYNNGLFWLESVSPTHPREVVVRDEDGERHTIVIHIEELDGARPPYQAVPFRLAYCLTAHTAQGGEWPTVYVSHVELRRKEANLTRHGGKRKELHQWAYTAITRAQTRLIFLMDHTFESERPLMPSKSFLPPVDPMLTSPDDEAQPLLTPAVEPEPDDIPDPVVPEATAVAVAPTPLPATFGEHEAIIQGAAQHLSRRLQDHFDGYAKRLMHEFDDVCGFLKDQLALNKERAQQAETLLDRLTTKALTEGLHLRHDPYVATVQVVTPSGFPMTFTVAQQSREALLDEMPQLIGWLKAHEFTAPAASPY